MTHLTSASILYIKLIYKTITKNAEDFLFIWLHGQLSCPSSTSRSVSRCARLSGSCECTSCSWLFFAYSCVWDSFSWLWASRCGALSCISCSTVVCSCCWYCPLASFACRKSCSFFLNISCSYCCGAFTCASSRCSWRLEHLKIQREYVKNCIPSRKITNLCFLFIYIYKLNNACVCVRVCACVRHGRPEF